MPVPPASPVVSVSSKTIESIDKFIRFSRVESTQLKLHILDSMYISAVNVAEKDKCAFPDMVDTVMTCWKVFLDNIAKTFNEKNFIWPRETKVFVRCYFNENGNIAYFFYNVKDTTFTRYQEFENVLRDFSTNYNFGLKCDKKYVQCGGAIFGKKE